MSEISKIRPVESDWSKLPKGPIDEGHRERRRKKPSKRNDEITISEEGREAYEQDRKKDKDK